MYMYIHIICILHNVYIHINIIKEDYIQYEGGT